MSYIEDCLYGYKDNLKLIEILKNNLDIISSMNKQNYTFFSGLATNDRDPVCNVVFRKMVIERRIARLEKRVKPVAKLYEDLSGSSFVYITRMKEILERRYFNKEHLGDIARALCISKSVAWDSGRELLAYARQFFKRE